MKLPSFGRPLLKQIKPGSRHSGQFPRNTEDDSRLVEKIVEVTQSGGAICSLQPNLMLCIPHTYFQGVLPCYFVPWTTASIVLPFLEERVDSWTEGVLNSET